jgi:hypothetical protein
MKKIARGGGSDSAASRARDNHRRRQKEKLIRDAKRALEDSDLLTVSAPSTKAVEKVVVAPESPSKTTQDSTPSKQESSGNATQTPSVATQPKSKSVKRITGSGRRRSSVDISSFVKALSTGDFDHTAIDREMLESFPVDKRLRGGAVEAFDKIVKPIVVEGTNKVLSSYSSKGTPYMSGDESRRVLSVKRDLSPAVFGFKATKEVPVSSEEAVVDQPVYTEEDPVDVAASVSAVQDLLDSHAPEASNPASDQALDALANTVRENARTEDTRRRSFARKAGRYGLGAAAVAALAYLAYRQYKKHKKRKNEKRAEDDSGWFDGWLDNKVPAYLVADWMKKKYYSGGLGKAVDLFSMSKTPEDVEYLNRMYPRLAFNAGKFIKDEFSDEDEPHEDTGAILSQAYDRFSASPGGELAKPLDEADVINSRIYSSLVPNKASKSVQPFDPRQAALRSLAASMRSPYGIPVFGTEAWDSPYFISPYFRGGKQITPSFLERDATMFSDNPEEKFYPSIANIGYAMPAVIGEYARNWLPGVDPNTIMDLDDRAALVEGSIASLARTYPSVRNLASMLANGYAGRHGEYTGPVEYKSDGNSVLLPGEKGYADSTMPVVHRGPLWDFSANALTPAGSNAWQQAVSSVYAPQVPESLYEPARRIRSQFAPNFVDLDGYIDTHISDEADKKLFREHSSEYTDLIYSKRSTKARLENAKEQLAAANSRGDGQASREFSSLIQTLSGELENINGRMIELEDSDPLLMDYKRAVNAAKIDGHFDNTPLRDVFTPATHHRRKDGGYVLNTPIADMVASGAKTVDDEWSKKIMPIAYQQGLKFFDDVGPHLFQPDTVVGPQALYANPGGLISDAVSAFKDNAADYAGKWDEVAQTFKDSTKDALGKAQGKVMGSGGK